MSTDDFFRARLDQMIDLAHPLAVLAQRMPWRQIEHALAPAFARRDRVGEAVAGNDLFGPRREVTGAGVSAAGRPRLPIRLMAALRYLKHAFNLSDEELVHGGSTRWRICHQNGRVGFGGKRIHRAAEFVTNPAGNAPWNSS